MLRVNIGFILGGTPEFLTDTHRGLYSYEALKTRLAENTFAKQLGISDYNSTVLRLSNLSKEELYILLRNLRHVFAYGDEQAYLIPDEALISFLNHCANKIGDSYFRTPRNTIKEFLNLLSILEQQPEFVWSNIIEEINIQKDVEDSPLAENTIKIAESITTESDEGFSTFKI